MFKKIVFNLKWFLYFLLTMEDRRHFQIAEIKGYDCIGSRDDSYILHGSATLYTFDKSKPPTRRYLTYKQYKKLHYAKDSNNQDNGNI